MISVISCTHCGTKYKVDSTKFASPKPKIRCKKCDNVFEANFEAAASVPATAPTPPPAPTAKPAAPAAAPTPTPVPKPAPVAPAPAPAAQRKTGKVLVGVEDDATRGQAVQVLRAAGHTVIEESDGILAFVALVQQKPDVAIVSVTLPKMYGFEISEISRRDEVLAKTKIVLMAATFDEERYKRNPGQLHGAVDYIEKHSIEKLLEGKIQALLGGGAAGGPAEKPNAAPSTKIAPPPAPVVAPAAAPASGALASLPPDVVKRAERLARIIVSDIALYNQKAIETGVAGGDYKAELENDLAEAKRHFAEKFPPEVIAAKDFIEFALEAYIAQKRAGS